MTSTNSHVDRRQSALVLIAVTLMVVVGGWIAVGAFAYRQFFVRASYWKWRDNTGISYWRGEILFAECGINLSTGPVGPSLPDSSSMPFMSWFGWATGAGSQFNVQSKNSHG